MDSSTKALYDILPQEDKNHAFHVYLYFRQLSLDNTDYLCYSVGIKEIRNEDLHYQRF
jgi:hypothetical protein